MSEERKRDSGRFVRDVDSSEGEMRGSSASRARNRTVLLTPETVGQVRASLSSDEVAADPISELLPPVSSGWEYPENAARGAAEPEVAAAPEADTRPQFDTRARPAMGRAGIGPSGQFTRPLRESAPVQTVRGSKTPTSNERRPVPAGFEEDRPAPRAKSAAKSKVVGFLVSFDTEEFGEVYEIRAGRWLVTSRPTEHGEYVLIEDGSISPMHAVIRATSEGKVQILDQLSEHGTGVTRTGGEIEEEVSGATVVVGHGDVVRFGKRRFTVCLIPGISSPTIQ